MLSFLVAAIALSQVLTSDEIDRELANWKPTKEDRVVPSDMYMVQDASFVGEWSNLRGAGCISVESLPKQVNRFKVEYWHDPFHSSGKRTRSTGRVENGVLILDKPIYELAPIDRLYAIKHRGKVRLVSARGWKEINHHQTDGDHIGFGIFTYGNRKVVKTKRDESPSSASGCAFPETCS